jgi:hypothetical protein
MTDLELLCKNQRFVPDRGYTAPISTRAECSNPAFADHNLHRVGFFRGRYCDQGIPGWSYVKKCVNCGREFDSVFFVEPKEAV